MLGGEDPFWEVAFSGYELSARDEPMGAALRLGSCGGYNPAQHCSEEAWSPAEVRVSQVVVPGLTMPICLREVLLVLNIAPD